MITQEERVITAHGAANGTPDEEMWAAVVAHDTQADGLFVYAVRSTGVYCRPSCPSRRPARAQVSFFQSPQEAEGAGFRACRRCHPAGAPPDRERAELLRRACLYIAELVEGGEPVRLAAVAAHVGASPSYLQRIFQSALGLSPRRYAEARRVERVKALLKEGESVAGAMYGAGYGSSSRLYEGATERFGMTPGEYGRGGRETQIAYATAPCPLGRLLVAATGKGVCAVRLGDNDPELEENLRREYPAARLERDDYALAAWVGEVVKHLEGSQPRLDLPVDVRATAFQRRVWEALRAIPYGATRSYSQVAESIGSPSAARAVARACATNPVALLVPCHRVLGAGGKLSGYRWGLWRKEALLKLEQAHAEAGAGEG